MSSVQYPIYGEVYLVLAVSHCQECGDPETQVIYDLAVPMQDGKRQWFLLCGRCYARRKGAGQVQLGIGRGQRYECVEIEGVDRWRISAGGLK